MTKSPRRNNRPKFFLTMSSFLFFVFSVGDSVKFIFSSTSDKRRLRCASYAY